MINQNKFLAALFCAVAALLSASQFIYIGQMYSKGTGAFVLDFSAALIFAAAVSLAIGAAGAIRNAVIASEAFFLSAAAMFFVEGFLNTAVRYVAMLNLIYIILSLLIAAAAVLALLYTLGKIKSKYTVAAFLALSWLICIVRSFSAIPLGALYFSVALVITGFLLIVLYPDILNEKKRVSMPEIIVLIISTFGIYYILWVFSLVKKTNALTERKGVIKYAASFVLLAPYRPYWYYTVYEELSEKTKIKNRGILCMALSVTGIFLSTLCLSNGLGEVQLAAAAAGELINLISLALLQRDINSLCPENGSVADGADSIKIAEDVDDIDDAENMENTDNINDTDNTDSTKIAADNENTESPSCASTEK